MLVAGSPAMSKPESRRIPKLLWFAAAAVLMVVLWVFLAVWLPYHREQVVISSRELANGYGQNRIHLGNVGYMLIQELSR